MSRQESVLWNSHPQAQILIFPYSSQMTGKTNLQML